MYFVCVLPFLIAILRKPEAAVQNRAPTNLIFVAVLSYFKIVQPHFFKHVWEILNSEILHKGKLIFFRVSKDSDKSAKGGATSNDEQDEKPTRPQRRKALRRPKVVKYVVSESSLNESSPAIQSPLNHQVH